MKDCLNLLAYVNRKNTQDNKGNIYRKYTDIKCRLPVATITNKT